jgi:hypothetical protein
MNARVGKEKMHSPTTGKQSLHKNTNDNGYRLIQFAALNNMVIGSTMFQHKNIHKSTWTAPDRSVVSMLASGIQHRGFEPGRSRRIFRAKIPHHAFLRRGSKAVCPMSQLCGMLKNPAIYVEVGIAGQIDQPFLAQFRPSLTEVSRVA